MVTLRGCSRGIILLILYINIFLIHQLNAQLKYDCSNTNGNYTQNSIFHTNLNSILSTVSSNINKDGFFFGTAGGQSDDQVSSIALCRGDVDNVTCHDCVTNAAHNLTGILCPNQKEAIVWYEECMFRYSNNSIQGIVSTVDLFLVNNEQASDVNSFTKELSLFADDLLKRASSGSFLKFAQGKSNNYSNEQVIYGYMQCTPDISPSDCMSCLNSTINDVSSCCNTRVGATILTPSCSFRYEKIPFLNQPSNQSPPPPPPPPLSPTSTGKKRKSKTTIIVVCVIVLFLVLTLCVCPFIIRRRWKKANTMHKQDEEGDGGNDDDFDGITQYDFALIRDATEGFSTTNMLGRGGFGEVYKGVLSDGKEIAVKRLSTTSGQGDTEFRNEVKLLAKLQHKSLVKLLGFCLIQKERLLVYEFMVNGSLDNILFDPVNRSMLDWERRYKIITNIAKGLLYLHEDSRLMIIHRDLKTSNILLDKEMNAKIADFGMARLFVLDEGEGVTKRIAGTFGYMAPEYAMHGLFSVKSDVYSFGVMLLEILSGKKNNSYLTQDKLEDLPSTAYKTWKEDKASDLIDPMLTADSDSLENMIRCMHIALLCVQENVGSRPTMAAVVLMLQSLTLTLPTPSDPGFFSNAKMIVPQWSLLSDFPESSSSSSQSKPILLSDSRSDQGLNVESYSHRHLR